MKKTLILSFMAFWAFAGTVSAQDKTAEELVSSMTKADMTYRELMETMGKSSSTIHEGILRQNKQMVEVGARFILTHPAPSHKPWTIMVKEDQADFKNSLLGFDGILDEHAKNIVEAAKQEDWLEASSSANELMDACISCHSMWKDKVQ
ncbi:MAG: hypothetical protein COB59_11625 [Rhodospirillaceae bacterium]|nr:MAG: hypothetical protein COB59_11625 [Rhodospirillaceae bacterium]